jgi:class 3 adenylate cyclase/tetratricopeptide (TPR) repeat protein
MRCPSCGADVPAGFAFCGVCGTRLAEVPATRPRDPGDRRVVTALISDLSGFTSLAERLDPEDLTNLINECFSGLVEEVHVRDGWIEKQIGDALVAIFGAPVAHEDDPARAVHTAMAMRKRMRVHSDRLGPQLGRALELHIGINTGLVVMSPGLETGEGDEIVVLGDAVNVAARLQQAAGTGQILVGEQTQALTSWAFEYRRLPPLTVKGKSEPVTIYECAGIRARSRPTPAEEAAKLSSPLVGRDHELALLGEQLDRLEAGRGGIVTVSGEAGIGKSRLVVEALRQRERPGIRSIEARALAFGQTIAYFPFIEIVKLDAGIADDDPEAESWTKLERRVRELLPEQYPEVLPYLATLLTLEVRDELAERVRYLDGEAMRHRIFRASRLYVERLADERPTLLIFEDFHWADPSSEALLQHLLPLVESARLAVWCLTRPDPDSPGGRFRALARADYPNRSSELALSQLSDTEATDLVKHLLQLEPSPRFAPLFRKTGGNPFFLEEVVRALIEVGAIERDSETGRLRVSARIDEITIPDTIQGVIMARVDRLGEDVRQVLRTASVIGRTFPYRVLSTVAEAQTDGKLDRCLGELESHELIREKQRRLEAELEYIFKHALTQETVYESILVRHRRDLHGQVARCMEELYDERLEEYYALLAYHYAHAEDWEKAQEYMLRAGDHAGQLAADDEAVTHYEQALVAYARAFGDRWNPLQRAVLERKIAEALFRRGEHERARARLEQALVYLDRPYPKTRRAVRRAILRNLGTQVRHRRLPRAGARGGEAGADERTIELARIYEALAWIDPFLDEEKLFLDSLLLANTSERYGFVPGIAMGSAALGFAFDAIPVHRIAERYHRRAVELAEQLDNPQVAGFTHFGLGFHEHRLGRWEGAIEHYRQATDHYIRTGDIRKWAAPAVLAGRISLMRGRLAEAIARLTALRDVGRDAGDHQSQGWAYFGLGQALNCLDRVDEALECQLTALPLLEAVPDYALAASTAGELARVYLRQDRLDEALETVERAERMIEERRLRGFLILEARLGSAETYLHAAEQADDAERSAWLKKAKAACSQAVAQTKWDREGLPAAYRLQARYHRLRGSERKAADWLRRAVAAAQELAEPHELGHATIELGQLSADAAEVERGRAMLARLRADYDAEVAARAPQVA